MRRCRDRLLRSGSCGNNSEDVLEESIVIIYVYSTRYIGTTMTIRYRHSAFRTLHSAAILAATFSAFVLPPRSIAPRPYIVRSAACQPSHHTSTESRSIPPHSEDTALTVGKAVRSIAKVTLLPSPSLSNTGPLAD